MTELELDLAMAQYARGIASAFGPLYRALRPRLWAFLAGRTRSPDLTAELVQETFFRLHRHRDTFHDSGGVVGWAFAIARNVHIDHVRAANARASATMTAAHRVPLAAPDAESMVIARRAADAVMSKLASLPCAHREAYSLIHREGCTVQIAASRVGATNSALKLRAFRAYEALRATLGDHLESQGQRGARLRAMPSGNRSLRRRLDARDAGAWIR